MLEVPLTNICEPYDCAVIISAAFPTPYIRFVVAYMRELKGYVMIIIALLSIAVMMPIREAKIFTV